MASNRPKRKRASDHSYTENPRKRSKVDSTEPPNIQSQGSSQPEFKARGILEEKGGKYLIDWEDDPVTGEKFEPTWEPKRNANEELVRDWEQQKLRKKPRQKLKCKGVARPSSSSAGSANSTPAKSRSTRQRLRRVIESSPGVGEAKEVASLDTSKARQNGEPNGLTTRSSPLFEPLENDDSRLSPGASVRPRFQHHEVQITQHSNFDPEEYAQYSSQQQDSLSSTPFRTPGISTSTGSHSFVVPSKSRRSLVIPDPQSLPGSSSYLPSTQTKSNSAHKVGRATQDFPTSSSTEAENPQSAVEELSTFGPFSSSAPVRESDPIEDPTSPVAPEEERSDRLPESPTQSASSASSPPPAESPGKSRSQSTNRPSQPNQNLHPDQSVAPAQERAHSSLQPHERPSEERQVTELTRVARKDPQDSVQESETQSDLEVVEPEPQAAAEDHPKQERQVASGLQRSQQSSENFSSEIPETTAQKVPCSTGEVARPLSASNEDVASNSQEESVRETTEEITARDPVGSISGVISPGVLNLINQDSVHISAQPSGVAWPVEISHRDVSPLQNESLSSPLPQVPSQWPETLGSNPPLRLQTPPDMSSNPIANMKNAHTSPAGSPLGTKGGLGERLKNMRAGLREVEKVARLARAASSTRSPSVIPEKRAEPQSVPQQLMAEGKLSSLAAAETKAVHSEPPAIQTAEIPHLNGDLARDVPRDPHLGRMEFIVPLPLEGMAGDQYRKAVVFYRDLIERFTCQSWAEDAPITKEAEKFVQTMCDISIHNDLTNDGTLIQKDVEPEDQARWDQTCSSKFRFLHYLLDRLREQDVHVVITASTGRLLDITETFLKGIHISYARPEFARTADPSKIKGSLLVTLLPTSGEGSDAMTHSVSAIITLDHTLDHSVSHFQSIRKRPETPEYLAPVISLVVVNTPEHIERYIAASLSKPARLRVLVSSIAELRQLAGKLPDGVANLQAMAMDVVRFLSVSGAEDQWPLPTIAPLEMEQLEDSQSTLSVSSSMPTGTQEISAAQKHHLTFDEDSEPAKRMRTTPQPDTMNPHDVSITRISDSVAEQASSNLPVIATKQDALSPNAQDIAILRARLEQTEARLQEHVAALSDLQYRFEDQVKETRALRVARDEALEAVAAGLQRLETQAAAILSLKEELGTSNKQAAQARAALENSSIPEIAEFEKLRREKEAAINDKTNLESKFAGLEKDFDFTRGQYQSASTLAASYAAENEALTAQIASLTSKASGEAVKLRQMHLDEAAKKMKDRCEMLEHMLKDREELLRRKEDELRSARGRQGVGTRAGSVPRSPRAPGLTLSRAGSPLPGRIGLLRNG